MNASRTIPVRVTHVEPVTQDVRRFTLESANQSRLPAYSAGSHVVVTMRGKERIWRNAYSLTTPAGTRDAYQIMVRRVPQSRGGSAFMHSEVHEGSELEISMPSNFFPIARCGAKHVMIAGGIDSETARVTPRFPRRAQLPRKIRYTGLLVSSL